MNGIQSVADERQVLLNGLLAAVKQCQIRFGGRTELATDGDEQVANVCHHFEAIFQHGLRKNYSGLAAIKHVTEIVTGLNLRNAEEEPVFWHIIREHLTRHEFERYYLLKNITTDAGRGRAWLRSALNEHSLERYTQMILGNHSLLCQYYEESAFLLDQERSSMLPMMAAGLGSILFAFKIDNADLNESLSAAVTTNLDDSVVAEDPPPVYANKSEGNIKLKKKKRKPPAQIVSFDEDDINETKHFSSSPSFFSAPPSCQSSPSQGINTVPLLSTSNPMPSRSTELLVRIVEPLSSSESNAEKDASSETAWQLDNSVSAVESDIDCSGSNDDFQPSEGSGIGDSSNADETKISEKLPIETAKGESNMLSKPLEGRVTALHAQSQLSASKSTDKKRVDSLTTAESTVLTPLNDNSIGDLILVPVGEEVHSEDSISLPSYSEDSECAAAALALQKVLNSSNSGLQLHIDNSSLTVGKSDRSDSLSNGDLKQAILALMQKKEEVDDQNKSLRNLLDREMEMCASLRIEMEEMKQKHLDKIDKAQNKIQALARENELLKHQLRKYVGAVQMLKHDGSKPNEALACLMGDSNIALPEQKPYIDCHLEATEYERKLIQVAEMHGELMEFNERLHRLLSQKESVVRRLREELIDLRGPLPDDNQTSDDDISVTSDYDTSSMTAATRALINIWIPSAFLTGKSSDSHHVYQIFIRIRDDEWNIYRRYAQFYVMHKSLKKRNPVVTTFEFPPKKAIGNKDAKFVEERRKRLQHYLRCVVNLLIQNHAELANCPDREGLIALLPFFGDVPGAEDNTSQRRTPRNLFSRFNSGHVSDPADHHYTGL